MEICSVLNYYHVVFSLPRIFEEVHGRAITLGKHHGRE